MFYRILEREAQRYRIELNAGQLERLEIYYKLLEQWNRKVNLIGPCSPLELIRHHLLESIYPLRFLPSHLSKQLDIGSGAGLPAIPLKIARPELSSTLLEPRLKRALFLKEAARLLRLEGFEVIRLRLEEFLAEKQRLEVELVTARAVSLRQQTLRELIDLLPAESMICLWHGPGSRLWQRLAANSQLCLVREQLFPHTRQRYFSLFQKRTVCST